MDLVGGKGFVHSYDGLRSQSPLFVKAEAALIVAPRIQMRQLPVSPPPKKSSTGLVFFP